MKAKIDRETRTVMFIEEDDMLSLVDSIESKNRRIVELMNFVRTKETSLKTDPQLLFAEATKASKDNLGGGDMEIDE